MHKLRSTPLTYVKGIGTAKATLLAEQLDLHTAADLLAHYPHTYIDRSNTLTIASLQPTHQTSNLSFTGHFITLNIVGNGAKSRLVGLFTDTTATIEIIWFRSIKTIQRNIHTSTPYTIFGKPTLFNGTWSIVHPDIETPQTTATLQPLRPVYPMTDALRRRSFSQQTLTTAIQTLLQTHTISDPIPQNILTQYNLIPLHQALHQIHNPANQTQIQQATYRIKFQEHLTLQLHNIIQCRLHAQNTPAKPFPHIGHYFNTFYRDHLKFPLTDAQKRVIRQIRADLSQPHQMNRLLQGDVGSGKTIVALLTMLIAVDNDAQAALMAPTEILAAQHYQSIRPQLAPLGINVALLTGSTPTAQRRTIHTQLLDGTLHIIIGTHALLEEKVQFKNLALAIIDEQHRFGVAQRARLWAKNTIPPHILVMTATPIPRTLAMTLYGDLTLSVIDQLPPGRQPIQTILRFDHQLYDTYRLIGQQIRQGRQAYIVYPLVNENPDLNLQSLQQGLQEISEIFRQYTVAFVHGQMPPEIKNHQMDLFVSGQAPILVATTVIEVGVNVPNATTIVIMNADRFGLSQLHQLRGRVGRGNYPSQCILHTKSTISSDTRRRLTLMTQTTDGFIIAQADLEMRGPGDIHTTQQSGLPIQLKLANLRDDTPIINLAHQVATQILDADPTLTLPAHACLRQHLLDTLAGHTDWSQIS